MKSSKTLRSGTAELIASVLKKSAEEEEKQPSYRPFSLEERVRKWNETARYRREHGLP